MKLCVLLVAALIPCLGQPLPADKDKAFGNPSAAVRLDIFSDFECPACREYHMQILPQVEKDYGANGKIYIVSHEFPLNIPAHKHNHEAANYATAAARIGKYEAVADRLFLTQVAWSASGKVWDAVATVLTPAEQKKVLALAKDPSVLAEVQNDYDLGMRLGVNSTPSLFITNGMRRFPLPNFNNYALFRSMVDGLK
jgi:protein-disulfide isomerase